MPPTPSLTLILAATPSLGIGKAGGLPWPQLRKEMGYFARVTKRVSRGVGTRTGDKSRVVNAVVMGRKTWDSIPEKFRPLAGRLNVVVTRDVGGVEGPLVVGSIADALARVSSLGKPAPSQDPSNEDNQSAPAVQVENVFVIGGASIYNAALALPQTKRVLLTKIQEEYECDTFFGLDLEGAEGWERASRERWAEVTGESVAEVEEKGVRFEFGLYERRESRIS
ncbi:hypothetical protein IQ07DRAFT_571204 [Pyrenochaeta sp. DS3sAY3a]|nr:hypothetical protein IQ07DRAFT_571204 [Pyrenochaeta sp. DS3sAY3a]